MQKQTVWNWWLLLLVLVCAKSLQAKDWGRQPLPKSLKADFVYRLSSEKTVAFEWQQQKYEWQVLSYSKNDDSHGASGALHVVLNKIDGEQKVEVAATQNAILCGSYGKCDVNQMALIEGDGQMSLLQIEAGVYSGQGHVFSTAFLVQQQGQEVLPMLCWFAEREGFCGDKEYKFNTTSKLILSGDTIQSLQLNTIGTCCSNDEAVEVQKRDVQIPYVKTKFKPDAEWIGNTICYLTAQDQ